MQLEGRVAESLLREEKKLMAEIADLERDEIPIIFS